MQNSITDFIGNLFGFNSKIEDLLNKNEALSEKAQTLNEQVTNLQTTLENTKDQDKKALTELQAKYDAATRQDPNEAYWDNRRPKINQNYIKYENRIVYNIDVRDFFTPNDANLPRVNGVNDDEKALAALKWVHSNVTYTDDKSNYGYNEYWAWAFETLSRKKGDCEDGAILIANILIVSGVAPWRIRLNAGSVNGGGHCYVTYCRETDNQWVVLDWCYWYTEALVKDRPLHKDSQNYSDLAKNFGIWFSWNKDYCYGSMETMIGMPRYFKK